MQREIPIIPWLSGHTRSFALGIIEEAFEQLGRSSNSVFPLYSVSLPYLHRCTAVNLAECRKGEETPPRITGCIYQRMKQKSACVLRIGTCQKRGGVTTAGTKGPAVSGSGRGRKKCVGWGNLEIHCLAC